MDFKKIIALFATVVAFVAASPSDNTPNSDKGGDYATGGGFAGDAFIDNSAPQIPIEQLKKNLKDWNEEAAEDRAFISLSEDVAKEYLKNIQNVKVYVMNYIAEKGSCYEMEDALKINPPPFQDEIEERQKDIEKCYERADISLSVHGDIIGNMKKAYVNMTKLKRQAEGKMLNIDALEKSIATIKSSIDIMERGEMRR